MLGLWLVTAIAAGQGIGDQSVLHDLSVEQLVELAQKHPSVRMAEGDLQLAHIGVNQATLTPIQGLTASTDITKGQFPGAGPQLTGALWLSVNVIDVMGYPGRIRSAKAAAANARARHELARRSVELRVRQAWISLHSLEESLNAQEEALSALEVSLGIASQLFVSQEIEIDQFTRVSAQTASARQLLLATKREYLQTVRELESLVGLTLAEVREVEQ